MKTLKVLKLRPDAILPTKGTPGSAGWDLYALEDVFFGSSTALIPTGLSLAIPDGFVGLVHARSSGFKNGLLVEGVIDSDYRGEVFVMMRAPGEFSRVCRKGERIAQLVIVPVPQLALEEVLVLPETRRGSGGFGSTGR